MTQPKMTQGPVAWHQTYQRETSGPDPSGRFVPGVEIGFATDNGMTGSVFVTHHDYNAATISERIAAKVKAMLQVAGLTGIVTP